LTKEAEDEKNRALEAARERVLLEFEKGQRSLGAAPAATTTSGTDTQSGMLLAGECLFQAYPSLGRGLKRKFEFDSTAAEALAQEAEEAALRQIEKEQAEALKDKLPDFWLPSLTPTYTSSGPPRSLKDIKLQTTCRGGNPSHPISCVQASVITLNKANVCRWHSLKSLIPVKFTLFTHDKDDKKDGVKEICPSCKKALSNNVLLYCACHSSTSLFPP